MIKKTSNISINILQFEDLNSSGLTIPDLRKISNFAKGRR